MKLAIYRQAISSGGIPAFKALEMGVRKCGDEVVWSDDLMEPADVAVHASGVKSGVLRNSKLSDARFTLAQRFGKRRLVVESAAIRQGRTDGAYWRLGLGGFLADETDFANENSPPDRWDIIAEEQGIYVEPMIRRDHGHILVVLQKPSDASLRGVDNYQWAREIVRNVRETLGDSAPILVRPHPLDTGFRELDGLPLSKNLSPGGLRHDLNKARACITFNSLTGIEAICAGVPTWAMDSGSLVYNISNHHIRRLPDPWIPDEQDVFQTLWNLAYCQWTIKELQEGTPWKRLRQKLCDNG